MSPAVAAQLTDGASGMSHRHQPALMSDDYKRGATGRGQHSHRHSSPNEWTSPRPASPPRSPDTISKVATHLYTDKTALNDMFFLLAVSSGPILHLFYMPRQGGEGGGRGANVSYLPLNRWPTARGELESNGSSMLNYSSKCAPLPFKRHT